MELKNSKSNKVKFKILKNNTPKFSLQIGFIKSVKLSPILLYNDCII